MPTTIKKSDDGARVWIDHQPGNCTKYIGVACKLPGDTGEWVVSFPEWGCSYYFNEGSAFHLGYVMEKLGMRRSGFMLNPVDIGEMMKMMTMMIPNTTCEVITDPTGHLLKE